MKTKELSNFMDEFMKRKEIYAESRVEYPQNF